MDHAPAPSWLDGHVDTRPGWIDAPAGGIVIDPADDADLALAGPSAIETSSTIADARVAAWLDDATISGLDDDVTPIEVTELDVATDAADDPEFSMPDTAGPSLVDPFDEIVAEDSAHAEAPDPLRLDDDIAPGGGPTPDTVIESGIETGIAESAEPDTGTVVIEAVEDEIDTPPTSEPGDYDAFDTFDDLDDADAVTDGIDSVGSPEPWSSPEPASDDGGYDAFDDLDNGVDG